MSKRADQASNTNVPHWIVRINYRMRTAAFAVTFSRQCAIR